MKFSRILTILCAVLPLAGLLHAKREKGSSRPELISPLPTISTGDPLENLQKAAAKGDPQASYELGERFLRGDGVKADVSKALPLLQQAATKGSADAAFRLGKLHEDGDRIPQDFAKAFSYYQQAAAIGLPVAQYNLGAMYASGRGVTRNYVEGLAWLTLASRNGADPEGEKQLRTHLEKINAQQLIDTANQRVAELTANPHSPPNITPTGGRSQITRLAPPRPQAPAKVDVGKSAPVSFIPATPPVAPSTPNLSQIQLPPPPVNQPVN